MGIKRVAVIGAGQMGSGIAQVAAEAGYAVVVREVSRPLLERGLGLVERNWTRAVERGTITRARKAEVAANLRGVVPLEELGECDLAIEAITEDLQAKKALFAALDKHCAPETILASNTSAMPIIEMAMATGRPDRVCGLHFFNPVPAMKLVEVVRTARTSEDVFRAALEFVTALGKEPVLARDEAGFVVNRLLVPYLLDAVRAVEGGLASIPDIDKGMRLGCGHPMGPLTLLDFIGLDTIAAVADVMFDEFRERRYAPPPLLRRMVRAGFYGKKSGRGFYDYSGPEPRVPELGV